MTAIKGGSSGNPGYFSDALAKAAVEKVIKADKDARKADKDAIKKATRKPLIGKIKKKRISGSAPLKRRQPRQDFFPAIHEAGTP